MSLDCVFGAAKSCIWHGESIILSHVSGAAADCRGELDVSAHGLVEGTYSTASTTYSELEICAGEEYFRVGLTKLWKTLFSRREILDLVWLL